MIASLLSLATLAYLFFGLAVLAPRKHGYRHLHHSISEMGEIGAPDQRVVAFGLFLPVGISLLVVALMTLASNIAVAALAMAIALGYVGGALFPCDPGSPMIGSARQGLHNLFGAVEYVGGGFALMTLARDFGQPFQAAGFIVLGSVFGLSVLPSGAGRGAVQRVAELCLFTGLALAAWQTEQ